LPREVTPPAQWPGGGDKSWLTRRVATFPGRPANAELPPRPIPGAATAKLAVIEAAALRLPDKERLHLADTTALGLFQSRVLERFLRLPWRG